MKKIILSMLLVLTVTLIGCATFTEFFNNNELLLKTAVTLSVAINLDKHPEWKSQMVNVTSDAIKAIDEKVVLDLDAVPYYIKKALKVDEMTYLTKIEVSAIIDSLVEITIKNLDEQKITSPELQLVEVKKVLTWVNETAQLAPDVLKAKLNN